MTYDLFYGYSHSELWRFRQIREQLAFEQKVEKIIEKGDEF
jgi:hypothetical protein